MTQSTPGEARRNGKRKHPSGLRCSCCEGIKAPEDFWPNSSRPDGRSAYCIPCETKKQRDKARGIKSPGTRAYEKRVANGGLRCATCTTVKPQEDFDRNVSRPDGRAGQCRSCFHKAYYAPAAGRYRYYRHGARNRNLVFDLTYEQFVALTSQLCFYCDGYSEGKDHVGVDRVDSLKGYVLSNCVPCCTACNLLKNTNDVFDFVNNILGIAARFNQGKLDVLARATARARPGAAESPPP